MHTQRLPRIITCRKAKHPRNKINLYANVQSVSRGTRVVHTVVRQSRRFFCSCESFGFQCVGTRKVCKHIRAVRLRLARMAA
jgi:predicted nucleic acid-binding Zn finger protein